MLLRVCMRYYINDDVFFFNDTATTEIYTYLHTLSLHDALPICAVAAILVVIALQPSRPGRDWLTCFADELNRALVAACRSEEHTSELQSIMRISYAVFCLKTQTKLRQ